MIEAVVCRFCGYEFPETNLSEREQPTQDMVDKLKKKWF